MVSPIISFCIIIFYCSHFNIYMKNLGNLYYLFLVCSLQRLPVCHVKWHSFVMCSDRRSLFFWMYSIYLNWLIEAMQGMWINKIIISLVSLGISIHVNYELYDLCVCIYLWCSVVRRIVRYCWLLLNLTVSVGLWS